MTIRRDEVEARVLKALREKLLRQHLFDEFCDAFTREMNGLVDAIVLTPTALGEALQLGLRSNLAAMLGATVQTKRWPESDDLSLQVSWLRGRATR